MTNFIVLLHEEIIPGKEPIGFFFSCQADDVFHAVEQAEDAYPQCVVKTAYREVQHGAK
jgi:hypothetical protein